MPELTPEEYAELKADIQERGVMVAIEFDENGNILDGYNRYKICQELGIKDYPRVIRAGMTEDQKFTHARKLNLARRHLSGEQLKAVIRDFHQRHPDIGQREIAKAVGASLGTVNETLKGCASVQNEQLRTKTQGADGRSRPASETQAERQRESIRNEIAEHPEKSNREIAREIGASDHTVATQRKRMVTVYNPSNRDREALKDPDIVRRIEYHKTGIYSIDKIRPSLRESGVDRRLRAA